MLHPLVFLGRDGVINVNHGHVHKLEEFDFIDGIFDFPRYAHKECYQLFYFLPTRLAMVAGTAQKMTFTNKLT